VRFAVVSCAKFNSGYFNAYSAISERDDLDFVLHLGDYIYEAGQTRAVAKHRGSTSAALSTLCMTVLPWTTITVDTRSTA